MRSPCGGRYTAPRTPNGSRSVPALELSSRPTTSYRGRPVLRARVLPGCQPDRPHPGLIRHPRGVGEPGHAGEQRGDHHDQRPRAHQRHGFSPRPATPVVDGDRPIPNPPHSARPGHQRMTPRPAAQPRTECRRPGRFPDQPGAAMTSRSRHRAARPGPRHTDTAAPPCAAAASPLTMASEYLVDNRSVPS